MDQKEFLVFALSKMSECSVCKTELYSGNIVKLEERQGEKLALCRKCAKLDHLEILNRGNAKLTRLASNYSSFKAIILRWSRSRNAMSAREYWWNLRQ